MDVQTAQNYFSSLNPMTKRIWQDWKTVELAQGEGWDGLDYEEQEALVDRFIVDPHIKEKYESDQGEAGQQDLDENFPIKKINCGEKIVVDFDHDDGWTWRDEHSGPFSWMSRSQQDLHLCDLEEGNDKKTKSRGRSKSPDRNNKSEKAVYDGTFLHSTGKNNVEAAHTADEIFQKFGIAFSFGHDAIQEDDASVKDAIGENMKINVEDVMDEVAQIEHTPISPRSLNEESKLLPDLEVVQSKYESTEFEISPLPAEIAIEREMPSDEQSTTSSPRSTPERAFDSSYKKKKEKEKHKWHSFKKSKPESEQALIPDLAVSVPQEDLGSGGDIEEDPGQVSPVFVGDPGESSTDFYIAAVHGSSQFMYSKEPSICESSSSYPTSEATTAICESDDWKLGLNVTEDPETAADSLKATGFDFLDNW